MLRSVIRSALNSAPLGLRERVNWVANKVYGAAERRYFFLFSQNLRRTNIQVAELIALLLQHSKVVDQGGKRKRVNPAYIEFTSFSTIKSHIGSMLEHADAAADTRVVEELTRHLSNKIILELHYGSASVFLPPDIETDIFRVCGESGYIHSCGHLLRIRNATKAGKEDFKAAIDSAFELHGSKAEFMLIPYCHEDFSPWDRQHASTLQHGLDDVKLSLAKAYVGDERLGSVLEREAVQRTGLMLAPPGSYKDLQVGGRRTIWVLYESEFVPGSLFPGEKRFYAIYLQAFKNLNVLHAFDENKPGWASHTTLPHTLTGAMINIGRPWAASPDDITVRDPFGGSGTTLLEASKLSCAHPYSSDGAWLNRLVVEDNIRFFTLDAGALKKMLERLSRFLVEEASRGEEEQAALGEDQQLVTFVLMVAKRWEEVSEGDFLRLTSSYVKEEISAVGPDLERRILLYTALKAVARQRIEIGRGTILPQQAFQRELGAVVAAGQRVLKTLAKEGLVDPPQGQAGRLVAVRDTYSVGVRAEIGNRSRLRKAGVLSDQFITRNVEASAKKPSRRNGHTLCDVIVTDPPYGFNTKEEFWTTAASVREWLVELIGSIDPSGGQLIMACPDVSFSGRAIVPFLSAGFLAREIVRTSADLGRECVRPSVNLPSSLGLVGPPYYWVAERTLRRKILHFWLREKGVVLTKQVRPHSKLPPGRRPGLSSV